MSEYEGPRLPEVLAALQLPIDLRGFELSSEEYFRDLGFAASDEPILIAEGLDDWDSSGIPNSLLRGLVQAGLIVGLPGSVSEATSRGYFAWFDQLCAGTNAWSGLSRLQARRLLSRLPLITHLLFDERMSCAQVARLLASVEASLDVPYQAVAVIARGIGHLPALDGTTISDELWSADEARSGILFPDSDAIESCEIAGREAAKYAPGAGVSELLLELAEFRGSRTGDFFWPYLQILHFCLVPIEYFDHPASFLYEFSPRGQIASALFDRYPANTGNPFLNNAKAVQSFDRNWAKNRGKNNAHALVELFELLDALPSPARRQLARILRAWLHRVLELETTSPIPLPDDLGLPGFRASLRFIETSDTQTHGVIEQRLVDCLSVLLFGGNGWRSKGLGESVNASNFSRHKLGDVEFANLSERSAVAIEAHGGRLTAAYVRDHQRSLSRIVAQRLDESWLALDDAANWSIRIIFVAHSRDSEGLPEEEVIHGVPVRYEYWDYREFVEAALGSAPDEELWMNAFSEYVVVPLNSRTARQSVRERFRTISASE